MKNMLLKLLLTLNVILPIALPQVVFADGSTRSKITEPTGTMSKSNEIKEIAKSADWMLETGPMIIAVGMLLFAAIMLVKAQYVMAIVIFLAGLLAAGALKIVQAVG